MADKKWSAFTNDGALEMGDVIVGLRSGVNVKFTPLSFNGSIDVTGAIKSTTGIQDSTGINVLTFTDTPLAVNYINITNATTGNYPSLSSNGSDPNIGFVLEAAGTGSIAFLSQSPDVAWEVISGTGEQHTTQFSFPNTSNLITVSIQDVSGTIALTSQLPSSGSPLSPANGGTGVNNSASTLTLGGNTAFSGAHSFTGTITADTTVTFPTSGTLATTSQLPSSGSPLSAANGGTGVSNSFNLTIGAASTINQNVSTTGTPTFASLTLNGNLTASGTLTSGTILGGTAGSLTLYSPTTLKGFLSLNSANNAGEFHVELINASFAQSSTITIIDPGTSTASFLLSTSGSGQTIAGGLSISGNFSTAPAVSSASTLVLGTAYQNTLGYDVILIVYVLVSAATSGSILSGVGTTTTPTQQTIIGSISTATNVFIPVTVYLPNNYYALISTGGTITAAISGQQVTPV